MNRVIKFRVWDNINKKYLWIFPSYIIDKIFAESHTDKPLEEREGRLFNRTGSDYILQQFTGLHDKNGVEIYEGDKDKNGGIVKWEESRAGFIVDYPGIEWEELTDASEWFVVSGNIYTTPELLNTSKQMKKYDYSIKLSKPWSNFDTFNKGNELEYTSGVYHFTGGTVDIYGEERFASFRIIYKGRMYSRTLSSLKHRLSNRSLLIFAGKFAREIINKK